MKLHFTGIQYSASDLVNFLGCKHLTELDRKQTLGEIEKPDWYDPAVVLLQQKGQEHESAYLNALIAKGCTIKTLTEHSNEATLEAMREGPDYIYQAYLGSGVWNGRADFLKRVQGDSSLGDYHYEIEDTKLAQETRAGTVVQLCLYTEMLTTLQEKEPECMYVIKPGEGFPKEPFRYANFKAYYRLIKSQFEQVLHNKPEVTYPMPVSKCQTCRWWKRCDEQWHEDDHLNLVAGIKTLHLKELENQEVGKLADYAKQSEPYQGKPKKGSIETYTKLHAQAKIQLLGRESGSTEYEILDIVEQRGLNRLPEPCEGDIYLDFEGDHFYEEGGLDYLLGYVIKDGEEPPAYTALWAHNRLEEKHAFETFMDLAIDRWNQFPGMYIYHYAPYEPVALKRLAQFHRTREVELDNLLRAERFIDVFSVLKESIRVSVESYSLKEVEKLTEFKRDADLREASAARRKIARSLEFKSQELILDTDKGIVQQYNREDCMATKALHQFLEQLYQELERGGKSLSRPNFKEGEGSQEIKARDIEAQEMFRLLTSGLPEDRTIWSDTDQGKWLLANLIDYYRREEKSAWWEFFRLQDLPTEDLVDERKAISGLKLAGTHQDSKRVPIHNYTFPSQEISLKNGADLFFDLGLKVGSIYDINSESGSVSIKKTGKTSDDHPDAVYANEFISSKILEGSLWKFIGFVIANGLERNGTYDAGKDLLMRRPPRLFEGTMAYESGEDAYQRSLRILSHLDHSVLPVQGPPGTGKTYNGSRWIVELVKQGKKVGVTAVSHSVILNFLDGVREQAKENGLGIKLKHKVSSNTKVEKGDDVSIKKNEEALLHLNQGCVVGGTSWLWANDLFEESVDYLFVDEAGQMSLANVLAVSKASKNLVLLGDPQQLEQPQKGAHPEGADISALQHILGDKQTLSDKQGIFLNTTYRLHPKIAHFTSEMYYDGRLNAVNGLEQQEIHGANSKFVGSGLFYHEVKHEGNQNSAPEEIKTISQIVKELTQQKLTWTDRLGATRPLHVEDILIVAPYNAQVGLLKTAMPQCRIGTVDKFQGQEAPVVIYSMTSSTPQDAPRGMSFLYNPNRLNVATSRAKCLCILVGSMALFQPACHSIDQMNWANGFCTYLEMCEQVMNQ